MTKDSYKEYEVKMEKSLQVLREELAGIRAGEPTAPARQGDCGLLRNTDTHHSAGQYCGT